MSRLQHYERPIAYLHQRLVAINTAEGGTVPDLDDLCMFRVREPGDSPPSEAGAAMLALIARRQFPGWALTFYDALQQAGKDAPPPPTLALVAADAILLAPRFTPRGWTGFLIAEGQASGQPRAFHPPDRPQTVTWLSVPVAPEAAAVWAVAAASLPTLPPPAGSDSPQAPPPAPSGNSPASTDDLAM